MRGGTGRLGDHLRLDLDVKGVSGASAGVGRATTEAAREGRDRTEGCHTVHFFLSLSAATPVKCTRRGMCVWGGGGDGGGQEEEKAGVGGMHMYHTGKLTIATRRKRMIQGFPMG